MTTDSLSIDALEDRLTVQDDPGAWREFLRRVVQSDTANHCVWLPARARAVCRKCAGVRSPVHTAGRCVR